MRKLLGLVLMMLPMVAVAQSGVDGTWKIDLNKAKIDSKPMVYELKGGMYSCSSCDPKIMIKADGTDQRVTGSPYIDTESVTVVNSNTIERVGKKNGKVTFRDTLTASPDGQTATQKYEGHPSAASDQTVSWSGTFSRIGKPQAGVHPVSGSWKVENYSGASNNILTFMYTSSGDGLRFKASTGESYNAKFDGREYPFQGDPGTTSVVLKKIDDHTFEETYMRNGQVTGSSRMTISPDGKTLTMVSVDNRMGRTDTWVAEKQGETMADK
jgi:hypothetical protein